MGRRFILFIALTMALRAQGPRPFPAWWERPWWDSPVVQDLSLTEAQQTEIRATVKEYRDRVLEIRKTIESADRDLGAVFAENPVDQRKASDAIERLVSARGELTRTLSQMSLKLRTVLTAEQWQELERRQPGRTGPSFGGRRGPGERPNRTPRAAPSSATKQ